MGTITITTSNSDILYEASATNELGEELVQRSLGGSPDEAVGCIIRELWLQNLLAGRLSMNYEHT